jgi:hypothetical protein
VAFGKHGNPLIQFLRHYGPVPVSGNLYDETIQSSAEETGIRPIEIELEELRNLVQNFKGPNPASVILTGTAGDGKTYLCRRVWESLEGDSTSWARGDKVHEVALPAGQRLIIIKDLSELTPDEKKNYLPRMAESITGQDHGEVFLLAANDGQLVAAWQHVARAFGNPCIEAGQTIQDLLSEEKEADEQHRVRLYNLGRNHSPKLFDRILDAIVEHEGWSQCADCIYRDASGEHRCPIREARKRLLPDPDNCFRKRLLQLLELAEANNQHLSIRHLLMLSLNMLLGHPKATNHLLDCEQVIRIVDRNDISLASPYSNAFGRNLPERARNQHLCFSVMESFGIGRETFNLLDDLLVYGADSEDLRKEYELLVAKDPYFGAYSVFETQRQKYIDGERNEGEVDQFLELLPPQRQRLFFTLPEDKHWDPWRLTVFRYGGAFLHLRDNLRNRRPVDGPLGILILGLNRVFTGMMTEERDRLFVATSGGDGRDRTGRLLPIPPIPVQEEGWGPFVNLYLPDGAHCPELRINLPSVTESPTLRLTPILHEYLRRIAEGSLPASFSHQCFEDLLSFKLRILKAAEAIKKEPPPGVLSFNLITVSQDGMIVDRKLQVKVQ